MSQCENLVLSQQRIQGAEARAPLTPVKTSKKRWPLIGAASFASHRVPLAQISGSATVSGTFFSQLYFRLWISSKDGRDSVFREVTLSRFVFMIQRQNNLRYWITFPVRGKYKFQVYGTTDTSDKATYDLVNILVQFFLCF